MLARAARSARLTTHFDLDFPRTPQIEPYWCYKHKRECRPVQRAEHFLRRYALDTLARVQAFAGVRDARADRDACCTATRASSSSAAPSTRVVTSPPYPGLIDYHEQHRYAYELLGLDDRATFELGTPARRRRAIARVHGGVARVLERSAASLRRGAPVVVVVNDRRDLYPEIFERAGLRLEHRVRRHVNRRTGRRAGEYFEDVLVARKSAEVGTQLTQ